MAIPALDPYPMPTPSSLPENQVSWRIEQHRVALLLHDMQAYFLEPFRRGESPHTELMANTVQLREHAARLGVPVIYTAQPGDMSRAERGLLHDFWGPGMSRKDSDIRIVPELAPAHGDVVLTKWRYSAFARSELRDVLARAGRDQLIVCGVYAHVGCLITAVDAFSADIQPFLVSDAVADFSAEYHRLALSYAAQRCAAVLCTEQVLGMLSSSGTRAEVADPVADSSLTSG